MSDWQWRKCANCGASGWTTWKRPGVTIFLGPCCRPLFFGRKP